jgi:hypothetical protein
MRASDRGFQIAVAYTADLIRLGVEQKLKRGCSLDYIRLERIVTAGPGNANLRPELV